ncbi:MAG: CarD family transcriptional regulator [Peptoniphilus harei]|uniref:CarD-like protein n=2 Tax=Peptoniphilus harei TaxID=54005 RepID=E4KXU2_9FIRM|nr:MULTISPECIES: CarD family transcriptional regulator [Peptoniphilus]EFR33331.1 CarD-like protein [Peptoniphilus harei ACS-146-V-Sch2b]KXA30411.1 CarD-like protein [Peptoniphilus harei]MDK7355064.1 CarD family transcriptional regulator [Peptoniphilus harei]MDK7370824.1 CarD family transcriptional regulator [Peptoniphilus harei]MDK7755341.1 CarD family transcriptional regulator [Peptoniphilus harei]
MFNIGDKIVYPMHGAGEIVAIEEREILGDVHKYYIMRLPINDLKVMVPVKNAKEIGVRDISDADTMEKVLKALSSEEEVSMPKNWNRRYRYNLDKIKSGDLMEIADVVRSLESLDREKSLSTGERKILNEAKQIIVSEMVLVFEKNVEEVTKLIDDAIFG